MPTVQFDRFISYTPGSSGGGTLRVGATIPLGTPKINPSVSITMYAGGSGGGVAAGTVEVNGDLIIPDLSVSLSGSSPTSDYGWGYHTAVVVIAGAAWTGGRFWSIYPNSPPYLMFYSWDSPAVGAGVFLRQRQSARTSLRQRIRRM